MDIRTYFEEEIMKKQCLIDECNLKEEELFKWYRKEKDGGLTELGLVQLRHRFKAEISIIRKQKRRHISDLRICKKKMDKALEKDQRRLEG